ncbi:MAG: hypothetical protein JNM93_06375 [Bacteriovoracaceae bacterium]|nr:hypothetical protein [Bacteriovoracaceae bacterium]
MLAFILYLVILPLFAQNIAPYQTYQIADLQMLAGEQNYLEFFEHARDIPPGQRNEDWQKMVISMAQNFTAQIKRNKQVDEKTFTLIEDLHTWPILKKDEFFTSDRNTIGKSYLEQCFVINQTKKNPCIEKLLIFWRRNPIYPELGVTIAELLRSQIDTGDLHAAAAMNQKIEINKSYHFQYFEFYRPALKDESIATFTCSKLPVQQLLLNEFYQLANTTTSTRIKQFHGELHPDCWAQIKKSFVLAITKNTNDKELAYLVLSGLKEIEEQTQSLYLTTYLLEKPVPGELFNLAWSNVMNLSKTKVKRDEILNLMKDIDPLPDRIFGSDDAIKKRSIARLFNDYFPEYIDHYTKSCLSFLTGKQTFENGNPTVHCRQYYELSKEQKILLPGLEEEFKKAFQI